MPRKYRSRIAEAMHGTVSGLHKAGLIDTKTLRNFDRRCLTEVLQLSATQIASLRKREGVSQAVIRNASRMVSVALVLIVLFGNWFMSKRAVRELSLVAIIPPVRSVATARP